MSQSETGMILCMRRWQPQKGSPKNGHDNRFPVGGRASVPPHVMSDLKARPKPVPNMMCRCRSLAPKRPKGHVWDRQGGIRSREHTHRAPHRNDKQSKHLAFFKARSERNGLIHVLPKLKTCYDGAQFGLDISLVVRATVRSAP